MFPRTLPYQPPDYNLENSTDQPNLSNAMYNIFLELYKITAKPAKTPAKITARP